jgi:hypothetical protein
MQKSNKKRAQSFAQNHRRTFLRIIPSYDRILSARSHLHNLCKLSQNAARLKSTTTLMSTDKNHMLTTLCLRLLR